MEIFKKHGAVIGLMLVVAFGFYQFGAHSARLSASAPSEELTNQTEDKPMAVDFSPFWRAWNLINEKYVSASSTAKAVGNQEKVYGAIQGLANSLGDPYTVFFPPVESKLFESDIRGNFEGVGMEVLAENGVLNVIAPLKDSPASKAGVQAGDKIIKIDGETTSGLSTDDAVQKIRGEKGSKVVLTVVRDGVKQPFDIPVTRAVIDLPIINTTALPGGIFKIDLYSFSATSPNLFRGALREFINSGDSKLIVDLRGNPGGYLEAAIDMASWFLPQSKVIVREDFAGTQDEKVYRSRGYDIFNETLKLVILVDKGSASASEILAGALQEQGKAVLVGEQTFGKGSVQELIDLTKDTSIKITVARWLTPNGNSISAKGITPDYVVPVTIEDRTAGHDPQLEKAIEILNK